MNVTSVTFGVTCVLLLINTSATLLSEEHFLSIINEHENSIAILCILKVMKKHIPCSTVVSFVYSNDDVNYLVETINNSECYTVIVRSFNDYNWLIRTDAYVILTETLEELEHGMSLITIDSFWNPRARIIAHAHQIEYSDIKKVFDVFIKYRTYNVIFITNRQDNAEVFTYFPFENGACGKEFNNATFITYCDSFSGVNFFPNKHINRMKNCTIRVLVSEDIPNIIIKKKNNRQVVRGIEAIIIRDMAAHEGLKVNYEIKSPHEGFGVVLPNHTATGLLASLQNNKADMAAGGFVLSKNRVDVFDYIYGFNFATFDVYTRSLDDPVWKQLHVEFDKETWLLVVVYFCIFAIVAVVILNVVPRIRHTVADIVLKLWAFFFLGNSTGPLLKVKRLRLLLICWIWFTFFISNFYTTALYSLITARVKDINNIIPEDLNSLPLKPCVSKHIREFFQYAYNQTLPENEPIPNCSYTETTLDTVASRTDLYALEMTYSYKIREDRFITEEGNNKLDAWRYSADKTLSILLARGYPLRETLQSYALRMYEFGFIQYHANNFLHRTRCVISSKPKFFRKVHLEDLKIHYVILLVGLALSALCLVVETLVKQMQINTVTSPKTN